MNGQRRDATDTADRTEAGQGLLRRHRATLARTAAAAAACFAYAGFAPSELRGTLLLYAAAATGLVGVVLFVHEALAKRLGSTTAVVAVASAVFVSTGLASLAADPCPVGGDGRCSPAGAGATGFAAMLVPLVVYVVYRLGTWTLRIVGRIAVKTIGTIRRAGSRGQRAATPAGSGAGPRRDGQRRRRR